MMRDKWEGCYNDNWIGDIVPEAFSHPAKFSRGLIHRIYQHAKEMGWAKPGDIVLDPFGGVALGGLDAMSMGLQWIGIELEEKFVKLGEQNIELWNRQLRGWHNLGTARIIQGDSRKIKDMIEKVDLICSSPPFASTLGSDINLKYDRRPDGKSFGAGKAMLNNYGSTPGNLANMKEGDIDMVVSSPPFCDKIPQQDADFQTPHDSLNRRRLDYGHTPGQLGSMKEGSVDAVISSPPYEDCMTTPKHGNDERYGMLVDRQYSDNFDNLGNQSGNTFWEASKEIVQGCYDLLKPNGHAIWVLKDYIKAGKRVPFSKNWASLCESVGFEIVCWHQASLVKEHGVQITLDNEEESIVTERKSFFRRLAEKKGSPRIDWEDIICMKKGG